MHVRHREDRNATDLEAALRAAEAAVKERLSYTIALTEKELFDNSTAETPCPGTLSDSDDADSDNEGLTEERGRRMFARGEGPPSPRPENAAVQQGYLEAATAATNAGASSSTLCLAHMCGNKRPLSEIDDNDPELNAALARAEAEPQS